MAPRTTRLAALVALTLATCVGGCGAAARVQDDRAAQRTLVHLAGRVTVERPTGAPIIVAALEVPPVAGMPLPIADYVVLGPEGGIYSFTLPPSTYRLAAFEDANRDVDYQPDERVGTWADFGDLDAAPGTSRGGLDLRVVEANPEGRDVALVDPTGASRRLHIGDVVPLDAPRFAPETGRLGMLEPLRFTRETGQGVLLLEPHREARIPVVFVHGIAGFPREFETLVARLDPALHEAWVVQYASGFDLSRIADDVRHALDELTLVHRLDTLCVVAHSMGGLVMRRALALHAEGAERARVPLFVTLASPLGGHPGATAGVAFSPVVLPVWESLVPTGPFVTALHRVPLGAETRYELLFAYGSADATGDGVVPLWSQLRPEAQAEAARVRGFRESHAGVLRADAPAAHVERALAEYCRR